MKYIFSLMTELVSKYKIGFDIRGLMLFLIIMTPNFIWFAVPAPNDILRNESVTPALDTAASICQVLMIVSLCIFINKDRKKPAFLYIVFVIACCILYFTSWIFYYFGVTNAAIILGLTVTPCLAFLFFAIAVKNMTAVIPISIFSICHLIYGTVNFIV